MQTTGGGASGPVGKRTQGSLERLLAQRRQEEALRARSDVGTARGGSYDPEVQRFNDFVQKHENDYTPLDFAKQVYQFPGKVYDDADQMVRGLIDLTGQVGSNVLNDQAPLEGMEADPIIKETINQWTHPVDYANEHPFAFMLDAAGAATLGGSALGRAARLRGATIPEWLGSEEGAIGRLGERLDADAAAGTFSPELRSVPREGMVPSLERRGMTNPEISVVDYGDVKGLGLSKEADWSNQGRPQIAYNELWNRVGMGEDLPKAGAALDPATERLITEAAIGARDAPPLKFQGMEHADDMKNITTMDYITGNSDRSFTHNMMDLNDRPLPIDEGMAFKSLNEDPRLDAWMGEPATSQQWPGMVLDAERRQLLDTSYAEMNQALDPEWHIPNYDALYENAGEAELQAAMARIENAQNRGTLFNMSGPPPSTLGSDPWGLNAPNKVPPLGSNAIKPNGPGLQAMIDRLAELRLSESPPPEAFASGASGEAYDRLTQIMDANPEGNLPAPIGQFNPNSYERVWQQLGPDIQEALAQRMTIEPDWMGGGSLLDNFTTMGPDEIPPHLFNQAERAVASQGYGLADILDALQILGP